MAHKNTRLCFILQTQKTAVLFRFKPPRKPILTRTEFSSSSRCWRTSAGNRLRSPASLSSAAWPDPSGKQRPTTRNRLKNNSSKIGLKQKTLAVLNPRCLTKAPRARCGEARRAPWPSSESMMTVPSAAVPAVSAAPPVPAPPAIIAMPPRPIVASPAGAVVARVVAVVRVARMIVIAPVSKGSRGHHR
jgi:hypothetical protein